MRKNICVIGGDLRQMTLYKELAGEFECAKLFGFEKLAECSEDLTALKDANVVVLPMPVTTDGVNVNAVYADKPIGLDAIAENISPSAIVFGGQIKPELSSALSARGIMYFDYFKREELAIKNAVPTAEGAIGIAINETAYTIHESKCLVLGYGRIGKILSHCLNALGARTTVCARRHADLAMAESLGCGALPISALEGCIGDYDVIFNTIPAMVLEGRLLKRVKSDSLIIDLASKPGGVGFLFG